MHLEGSHAFAAPPDRIWALLDDPEVLARTTPGLTHLEPEGPNLYQAEFKIKLGPVDSGFSGSLAVRDKDPPRSYRLEIDVAGRVGAAKAEGTFDLQAREEGTRLVFAGDARLSGLLARMGGRVLTAVSRKFTNQFFNALEQELEAPRP